jgi:hypothetical protein
MPVLNFPNSPNVNDIFTVGGSSWVWNGSVWDAVPATALGYSGSKGYTGSVGYVGSLGYSGSIGYSGSRGYSGSVGYAGSAGAGYTGSAGAGYTGSASTVVGYTGSFGYSGSKGESSYSASQAAPLNPKLGDRWFNLIDGVELVWTFDGDSTQWVEIAASGFLGYTGSAGTTSNVLTVSDFNFNITNGIITPTGKTKTSFYNSAANTWTVPTGITKIFVKMWGAGGGGGSYGGWRQGGLGGAGGFSHALFTVVPGEIIQIRPGGCGTDRPGATTAYPDGGGASTGGGDNQYTANGGGSSSIRIPSVSATVYAMYAGGGGGGASCNGFAVNSGGAGGGLVGQPGTRSGNYTTNNYGGGGTQLAGGSAGATGNTTGGAGSAGQGGTHQHSNNYGGGGGGGYYGGGSGSYVNNNSMGGGGGGSGYIHANAIFGATYTGSYRIPPFANDPDLMADPSLQNAFGGEESGQGGPGVIVIYY